MVKQIRPLPGKILNWKVIEDLGMVELGKGYRKRLVILACPFCGNTKTFQLGNLHKEKSLRCISDICRRGSLSNRYYGMINRCYNDKVKSYRTHGAKGIRVCSLWLNEPLEFVKWAKTNGFKEELFLDRIDNNKDYSPENCRWVTSSDSCMNRGLFKNSTTGYRNIARYKNPRSPKERFQVRVKGHRVGYFDTMGEAIKARDQYIKSLDKKW